METRKKKPRFGWSRDPDKRGLLDMWFLYKSCLFWKGDMVGGWWGRKDYPDIFVHSGNGHLPVDSS
jgi:hypothetical protein